MIDHTVNFSQTLSKRPSAYCLGNVSPFIRSASGCELWNVEGHRMVDWVCGMGAVTLGHDYFSFPNERDTHVDSWVHWEGGQCYPLPSVLENQVAEKLCSIIPIAEQVRFVKTGSEACAGAVRIARMATGRDGIIVVGYHGWHDWYAASKAEHPGVPSNLSELVSNAAYNDLESLDLYIRGWGEWYVEPAAVILEPTLNNPPDPGYLQGVIDLAHEHGALVIFDEMVCGFRWALAGGMEYFGVKPDLATFGKGMANGFPLSCIVGTCDLMRHAWCVSGTFGGEQLSLKMCERVLEEYRGKNVIEHLWEIGRYWKEKFNAGPWWDNEEPYGLYLENYPVHPRFSIMTWKDEFRSMPDWPKKKSAMLGIFQQLMAEAGHLIHQSGCNVMYAHTKSHVDDFIQQFERRYDEWRTISEGMLNGSVDCAPYLVDGHPGGRN